MHRELFLRDFSGKCQDFHRQGLICSLKDVEKLGYLPCPIPQKEVNQFELLSPVSRCIRKTDQVLQLVFTF